MHIGAYLARPYYITNTLPVASSYKKDTPNWCTSFRPSCGRGLNIPSFAFARTGSCMLYQISAPFQKTSLLIMANVAQPPAGQPMFVPPGVAPQAAAPMPVSMAAQPGSVMYYPQMAGANMPVSQVIPCVKSSY